MSRRAPRAMLRLALTPRWLLAAGLVVLLAIAGIFLGRWQWDRTQSILAAERAAQSAPVVVEEAMADAGAPSLEPDSIGRPVIADGEYVPELQVAITSREHAGLPGVWIVTALRLDDGRLVPVLRGWLPDAEAPGSRAPEGRVSVSGVMQPDETFYADAANAPGALSAIAHQALAREWGEAVPPGFVVLAAQTPATSPAPTPVVPTVQTSDVAFPLQNFVYAFQWWLFALFGIVVFGRWLWLETRRDQESTPISKP